MRQLCAACSVDAILRCSEWIGRAMHSMYGQYAPCALAGLNDGICHDQSMFFGFIEATNHWNISIAHLENPRGNQICIIATFSLSFPLKPKTRSWTDHTVDCVPSIVCTYTHSSAAISSTTTNRSVPQRSLVSCCWVRTIARCFRQTNLQKWLFAVKWICIFCALAH